MESLETSLDLFCKMWTIRSAETAISSYYGQDEMKTPVHQSAGSEAIAAGVCAALTPDDQILASYRTHGAYLAKTNDVEGFFLELYGKKGGPADGRAGSMHLADPERNHLLSSAVVGSQIPVAVGAALANKYLHQPGRAVAVFFGDGATDQGVFWESLNAACLWKLPVLFVCEDNGWSVQTPVNARRGYRDLPSMLDHYYCHVRYLNEPDCADVEQVYGIAAMVLRSMRMKPAPGFLHIPYCRMREHVGIDADWDEGYREFERDRSIDLDPIAIQRTKFVARGANDHCLKIMGDVNLRVGNAIKKAKAAPPAVNYETADLLPSN